MSNIRAAINREKKYVLMLAFIFLVNAWFMLTEKIPEIKAGIMQRKALRVNGSFRETEQVKRGYKEFEKVDWQKVLEEKKYLYILLNILGLAAFFFFSLGLFLDVRILMAKVRKRDLFKTFRQDFRVRWRIADIFKLAIIFVFLGYLLNITEANLLLSGLNKQGLLPVVPLLNSGILDLLLLGLIIYFIRVKYNHRLNEIGLETKNIGRLIRLGVLSYIAFLPILSLILLLLMIIATVFNYQPPAQPIFNLFLQEQRFGLLIYSTLLVVILGPLVEEIFFRGFSYTALKGKLNPLSAMLLTSAVFAGLHGNLFGFLPIMALGLLLVYVYEKTGSLIPAITIHILHNGLMIGLLFTGKYFLYAAQ